MFKKILIATVSCALYMVSLYAAETKQAETKQLDTVLATVDGKAVTKDDVYLALIQTFPKQANETLNRLVNGILIENEAAKRKITASPDEIARRAQESGLTGELSVTVKNMITTSILAEKMIIDEKKLKVTKEEVKSFFDANKDKLGEPEQIKLRRIFVTSQAEANDLSLALNAGADFAKMAQAKSQDNSTKDKGGDAGYFTRGMLLPEIEKIVFEMKVGDISQPVKTSAGFVIFKAEDKKEAKEAKFDKEMQARLNKLILNNKVQQELDPFLEGLRKKAEIK